MSLVVSDVIHRWKTNLVFQINEKNSDVSLFYLLRFLLMK